MKVLNLLLHLIILLILHQTIWILKQESDSICFKQDKITYTHGNVVNIYIVYEINKNDSTSSDPALENCLFGPVSLTKMRILISINILDMELDLIDMDF